MLNRYLFREKKNVTLFFLCMLLFCGCHACEHLYEGKPCIDKKTLSLESIVKCAESGDLASQVNLAYIYSKGIPGKGLHLEEALKWDLRAAKQGCAKSQLQVGYAFYYGDGVQPSVRKAEHWWRLAAEQDDPDALCALGYITYTGEIEIVEANYLNLAFSLIHKSVELGSNNCVSYLAKLVFLGEGTKKDIVLAKQIIDEAYKKNLPNSSLVRSEIYRDRRSNRSIGSESLIP